jgi:hypothetical protein
MSSTAFVRDSRRNSRLSQSIDQLTRTTQAAQSLQRLTNAGTRDIPGYAAMDPELDGIILRASGCRHQINTNVFTVGSVPRIGARSLGASPEGRIRPPHKHIISMEAVTTLVLSMTVRCIDTGHLPTRSHTHTHTHTHYIHPRST